MKVVFNAECRLLDFVVQGFRLIWTELVRVLYWSKGLELYLRVLSLME